MNENLGPCDSCIHKDVCEAKRVWNNVKYATEKSYQFMTLDLLCDKWESEVTP